MSEDLELILSVAAPPRRPVLVELGVARAPCGDRRLFVWSSGRVAAAVDRDEVRLERGLGSMGTSGGASIPRAALPALVAAVDHWTKHRDRWAAFYGSSSGYPPGYGGAWYFQPPGKRSKPVKLGSSSLGGKTGKALQGRDVRHALKRPVELAHGAHVVSRLRRMGEEQTPPEGLVVGVVYTLFGTFRLIAWRNEAKLIARRRSVWLEDGDEEFVRALSRARNGTRRR